MQPLFTIHVGEYLVRSHIEQHLRDPNGDKVNVWVPSKDTGIDLFVTDKTNKKGTNWRMTEVQGVIGRIQLKRMGEWTAARTRNALRIWETCRQSDAVRVPEFDEAGGSVHAHYKCYVQVRPESLVEGWNRDRIVNEIRVVALTV